MDYAIRTRSHSVDYAWQYSASFRKEVAAKVRRYMSDGTKGIAVLKQGNIFHVCLAGLLQLGDIPIPQDKVGTPVRLDIIISTNQGQAETFAVHFLEHWDKPGVLFPGIVKWTDNEHWEPVAEKIQTAIQNMLPLPLNNSLFPYQRFGESNIENVNIALGEVKNYFDLTQAEGVKLVIETGKILSQDIIDEIKKTADIYLAKKEPSAVKPYPAKKQDEPKQGFWKIFLPLLLGLIIGAAGVIGVDAVGFVKMPSHTRSYNTGYDQGNKSRDNEVKGLNDKVKTLECEKTELGEEKEKAVQSKNILEDKIRKDLNSLLQQLPYEEVLKKKYVSKEILDTNIKNIISGLENKSSNLPNQSIPAKEQ